jgi:hypothetical protein
LEIQINKSPKPMPLALLQEETENTYQQQETWYE